MMPEISASCRIQMAPRTLPFKHPTKLDNRRQAEDASAHGRGRKSTFFPCFSLPTTSGLPWMLPRQPQHLPSIRCISDNHPSLWTAIALSADDHGIVSASGIDSRLSGMSLRYQQATDDERLQGLHSQGADASIHPSA